MLLFSLCCSFSSSVSRYDKACSCSSSVFFSSFALVFFKMFIKFSFSFMSLFVYFFVLYSVGHFVAVF